MTSKATIKAEFLCTAILTLLGSELKACEIHAISIRCSRLGQAKRTVIRMFDDTMYDSIVTDLTGSCGRDIGLRALETAACS